jgi:hypothetical protein
MNQVEKDYVIDVVNVAAFNGVLDGWCNVKKNSHNKYAGLITIWFDDEDEDERHNLRKINPSLIWGAITDLCQKDFGGLDEEIEKRILLSFKRKDASVLEYDDILTIFQVAVFEEV